MNTKIKLAVLSIIAIVGLFAGASFTNAQSATPSCNDAILYGTVTTNGDPTEAWFEWGQDSSLPYQTPHQTFNSDSRFSQTISNLSENTTYYWRAMARNSNGTATGSTMSFRTNTCSQPAAAPDVTLTPPSQNIAYNGNATISWQGTNANSCTASGGTGNWAGSGKNTSGSMTFFNLTSPTYSFYMYCSNSAGAVSQTKLATVSVGNPPQTCNDPNANNNGAVGTCTYPPQTCQDPVANNYRGSLPCTYPPRCTDTNATNYNQTGSCIYPARCLDTNATNYGGYGTCTYTQRCLDTSATNYGANGTCTYNQRCLDTNASNYGGYGTCTYNTYNQRCLDVNATNYGANGTCTYNNYNNQRCLDTNATNYGSYSTCIYQSARPTVSIYADQTTVPYNGSTYIRWNTTNATSCTAFNGSPGWAGSKSIGPGSFFTASLTTTYTYDITCYNSTGSANDSVTVVVRSRPVFVNTSTRIVTQPVIPATSYVSITASVDRTQPIVPTLDNTRPEPGDEINYTVNYQNVGTGTVTGLILRINLPSEVDYLYSNPSNPTILGNTLVFSLGSLRPNTGGTVTVRTRVRENIPAGTNLNFPATLDYFDPAGRPQSVSANVTAQVIKKADLAQPVPAVTSETTNLGASVLGTGFLPTTLFGWLFLLLILLLIALIINRLMTGRRATVVEHIDHHL